MNLLIYRLYRKIVGSGIELIAVAVEACHEPSRRVPANFDIYYLYSYYYWLLGQAGNCGERQYLEPGTLVPP